MFTPWVQLEAVSYLITQIESINSSLQIQGECNTLL